MKRYKNKTSLAVLLMGSTLLTMNNSQANLLNTSLGGSFSMSMDRDALAYSTGGTSSNPGHYLVHYYDTTESNYLTRTDSSFYFNNALRTEVSAINMVHDLTAISATNPVGQASNRHVKATSPNFAIDSESLTGTGVLGMTGIELYKGLYNGTLIYGDYSLQYNPANRALAWEDYGLTTSAPSGWYLQNNVSFSAVVYDLSGLSVVADDANNWKLTGDLLLSPENAGLIQNTAQLDVGNFCLGTGSYSQCGQISAVPLPSAVWLFISGLSGLGLMRKKFGKNHAA